MIREYTKEIIDELIKIRRDLHAIPELENEEYMTCNYIENILRKYQIPYKHVLDTGLVAHIKGSLGDGKTILIRADIDALPINEMNDVDYKSTHGGIMHACGHDVHIACALGVCILAKEIDFRGNIVVAFQPAEEGNGGAKRMIDNGILENPKVDAAIALHVEPCEEVGTLLFRKGSIMASPDDFKIIVTGKGGHGACPELCINPVECASYLAYIITQDFKYAENCVVSVCKINGGTSSNVIPDSVEILGTARSINNETRKHIETKLFEITQSICKKFNCKYEFVFNKLYPPVINDTSMNNLLIQTAENLGLCIKEQEKASMTGDDFSYFSDIIPSVYFKLGAGNEIINKPLHSAWFNVDENCIEIGTSVLMRFCMMFFEKGLQ
ncbi:MAG: amidohydrolase [Clostridia bacterium]|nr:amidohydrolase [Clostridia bacterium]